MNRVRQVREARGLKQRELSEQAHTCQALVSSIEREVLKPWPKVAERLSEALGVPVEELFPQDRDRLLSLIGKQ